MAGLLAERRLGHPRAEARNYENHEKDERHERQEKGFEKMAGLIIYLLLFLSRLSWFIFRGRWSQLDTPISVFTRLCFGL